MMRRLVGCLIVGVLATVVTSWCGVILFRPTSLTTSYRPLDDAAGEGLGVLNVSNHVGFGVVAVRASAGPMRCNVPYMGVEPSEPERLMPRWCRGYVLARLRDHADLAVPETVLDGYVWIEARGWPRPALWCVPAKPGSCFSPYEPAEGGIALPAWMDWTDDHGLNLPTLPCRPIWTGLAVNTVTFAAAIGLLLPVPRLIVERRRARRGECVACGYDLSATEPERPCPECGAAR